jgi:hypothetical protein
MAGKDDDRGEARKFPHTTSSRIENGAIVPEMAKLVTSGKLSVVFHATGGDDDSQVYAWEVYSMTWDAVISIHEHEREGGREGWRLLNLIEYSPKTSPTLPPKERLSYVLTCCECATAISSPRGVGARGIAAGARHCHEC